VAVDDPRDLRLYVYDIASGALAPAFFTVRLDAPSQTVDLASLTDVSGARVYPGVAAPAAGPVAIGELKAVNDRQLYLASIGPLALAGLALALLPRWHAVAMVAVAAVLGAATIARTVRVRFVPVSPSGTG